MSMPTTPAPRADVLAALAAFRSGDAPTTGGRVLAYVYDSGLPELDDVATAALAAFSGVNGLDPTVFPSVAAIENDLVGWGLDLLGGPPDAVGLVTSGGTESCMLAVKTARENWRASAAPDAGRPVMIAPITVHSAFVKAAKYFDVEARLLPVGTESFMVDPADVAAALDDVAERACLVVVSAPSYAHGVIDPVVAVTEVAAPRGVPVHVDACIGGWVLPFMAQQDFDVPPFDLSVPGVRSLSVDLHKYAYAPKGASLLLFSDAAYRLGAFFTYSGWPGYPVVNTTMQSTKSAGPMAAAWATISAIGSDGYRELVLATRVATEQIVSAVAEIPGLRVLGDPASTLIALAADGAEPADPFVLADRMHARGWFIQPQPAVHGMPRTAHLTVQATTLANVAEFLQALRESAAEARALPAAAPAPELLAAAESLDPDVLDLATIAQLLVFAGLDAAKGPSLPDESADVQALLEALPVGLRDRLLAGFFSEIFQPHR